MEEWAQIRALRKRGLSLRKIAEQVGCSKNTVSRSSRPKVFDEVASTVRALLEETPNMPAAVLAQRVGWTEVRSFVSQGISEDPQSVSGIKIRLIACFLSSVGDGSFSFTLYGGVPFTLAHYRGFGFWCFGYEDQAGNIADFGKVKNGFAICFSYFPFPAIVIT